MAELGRARPHRVPCCGTLVVMSLNPRCGGHHWACRLTVGALGAGLAVAGSASDPRSLATPAAYPSPPKSGTCQVDKFSLTETSLPTAVKGLLSPEVGGHTGQRRGCKARILTAGERSSCLRTHFIDGETERRLLRSPREYGLDKIWVPNFRHLCV